MKEQIKTRWNEACNLQRLCFIFHDKILDYICCQASDQPRRTAFTRLLGPSRSSRVTSHTLPLLLRRT